MRLSTAQVVSVFYQVLGAPQGSGALQEASGASSGCAGGDDCMMENEEGAGKRVTSTCECVRLCVHERVRARRPLWVSVGVCAYVRVSFFFFGGFLFINVSPTFPPHLQSLPSTPPPKRRQ